MKKLLLILLILVSWSAWADPVMVPKPGVTGKKARLLCPTNLTPVLGRNWWWVNDGHQSEPDKNGRMMWQREDDCHDFMVSVGYRECYFVYIGSFSQIKMFAHTDPLTGKIVLENVDGRSLDWSRASGAKRADGSIVPRFDDPFDDEALRIIGNLSMNPSKYGNKTAARGLPIVFDLEGTYSWALDPSGNGISYNHPDIDKVKPIRTLTAMAERLHNYTDSEIWNYGDAWLWNGLRPVGLDSEVEKYYNQFNATVIGLYFTDLEAQTPDSWQGTVGRCDKLIRRWCNYNYRNKIVVITPTWQIYDPLRRIWIAGLSGQPVPMSTWCKFIDNLLDEDYDTFIVWPGYTQLTDEVKARLLYIAQYRNN